MRSSALGYTMVLWVLRLINFAHGDVFMVGPYIGFYSAYQNFPYHEPSIPAHFYYGRRDDRRRDGRIAIERFAYRPVRKYSRLTLS